MIELFIVDDHPLVIEGIRVSLLNEPEIRWTGHALNATKCLEYFKTNSCDIILMDINLPDMSGIELCKIMSEKYPGIRIIALSTFNQGSYVTKMMEHGAMGYIVKNADKQEIIDAIRSVYQGKKHLSFEAEQSVNFQKEMNKLIPVLTKREKEILKLIVGGLTNPQIAKDLFISTDTVDSHRKNLLAKLKASNTASLVRIALQNELV